MLSSCGLNAILYEVQPVCVRFSILKHLELFADGIVNVRLNLSLKTAAPILLRNVIGPNRHAFVFPYIYMPVLSPDSHLNLEMDFTFMLFKPIGLDDAVLWVRVKNPSLSPGYFRVRMGFL